MHFCRHAVDCQLKIPTSSVSIAICPSRSLVGRDHHQIFPVECHPAKCS